MNLKFIPVVLLALLLAVACMPTPTLAPTDTPPPPTYTPVVIPTQDILERFCQSDNYYLSPYWSCSCGNYTETRLQDDYNTEAEVFYPTALSSQDFAT